MRDLDFDWHVNSGNGERRGLSPTCENPRQPRRAYAPTLEATLHQDRLARVVDNGGEVVDVRADDDRLLDNLGQKYPAISGRLFENGQVRRFINLYLNDEDIRYLDNLDTAVKDGDEVSIIPAVAGG